MAEEQLIRQEATPLVEAVVAMQITDQSSYDFAIEKMGEANGLMKRIDAFFDPLIVKNREALKIARDRKELIYGPVSRAFQTCKQKLKEWDWRQEQARRERQRKLNEQARREEERLRRAEVARAQAAGATKKDIKHIEQRPSTRPAPVAAPTFEASSSMHMRDNWLGEGLDLSKTVQAAAKNPRFLKFLKWDQVALNAEAKATKEAFDVPGARSVNDRRVVAKGGR